MIPKILTSSILKNSEQRGKEKIVYKEVHEFEPSLAKDIEEALQMANDLAAERGLGDMTISPSSSSAVATSATGATATRGGGDNTNANSVRKENEKPFMFRENNAAADWNRDLTGQKKQALMQMDEKDLNVDRGKESRGPLRRDVVNAREEKPSLFHENNASRGGRDDHDGRSVRKASGEGKRYVNAADVKPLINHMGSRGEKSLNHDGNSREGKNWNVKKTFREGESFMNAADVKPIAEDVGVQADRSLKNDNNGDDRAGWNVRKPVGEVESYVDAADIKPATDHLGARGNQSFDKGKSRGDHDGWNVRQPVGKRERYANAADVRPAADHLGSQGDTSLNDRNFREDRDDWKHARRNPEPYANTADVNHDDARKKVVNNSHYPSENDLTTNTHAGESEGYVNAATLAAKAAWEKAVSSSKPLFHPYPPPMDGVTGSFPPKPHDTSSSEVEKINRNRKLDINKSRIGSRNGAYNYASTREDNARNNGREKEYDIQANRRQEQQNDRSGVYSSNPDSTVGAPSMQQARVMGRNAKETSDEAYSRYKQYFQGGIDDGSDDEYASQRQANASNNNSRKIVITDSALELARSLKLDIYEIFQHKQRDLDVDITDGGENQATVNENDVRDYLDRRYERLFSKLATEKKERRQQQSRRRESPRGLHVRRPPPVNLGVEISAHGARTRKPEKSDFVAEDDFEAFHDNQAKNKDDYGWKTSQFRRHASNHRPQLRRSSEQQQQQDETFHPYQNDNSSRMSQSSIIPPISSVPLSKLISNPKSKQKEDTLNPDQNSSSPQMSRSSIAHPVASVPLSQLISNPRLEQSENRLSAQSPPESIGSRQSLSQAKFRQPYQEQQQWNAAMVDNKRENVSKRSSFQDMSQSKFREPYQKRSVVDYTMAASQPIPIQQVAKDDFAEQQRQAFAEDDVQP